MEKVACNRRVRKAPKLGGADGARYAYTICNPPLFYHPWLRKCLRKRARTIIDTEWVKQEERSRIRWEATTELADWETQEAERKEAEAEESEASVRARLGGMVGTMGATAPLPANTLMTLPMFDSMSWTKDAMRMKKWTIAAVKNQMKLRNLPERRQRRSQRELDEFNRHGLLATRKKLRVGAGTAVAHAELLRKVLEAEATAAAAASAVAQSDARLEVEATARARHSRRGRGQAAVRMEDA